MRYFFALFIFITVSTHNGFAAEKSATYTSADTVRITLSIILKNSQTKYDYYLYPLIVHLYNQYTPDSLLIYPEQYKSKLDEFYYKRYFLYSKLTDKNAIVTSDCMKEEESGNWNGIYKLLFYGLYDGPTWKFPADYVQKLEEYATQDPFYGPLQSLVNIYFLKQYNWDKLTAKDKKDLKELENKFCNNLYSAYIENKDWGYSKLYALWAIRINKNHVADAVNINELTDYFDRKNWMIRFDKDFQNKELMNRVGSSTTAVNNLCAFWLFTLNK